MFVSGIGHVLSISGYHMAVVAGVVFFFLRAVLALIPGVADRMPIKKWAAFAALLVTAFYLVLSGAEVATQRSFIMIAIVLIGVMLDRPILTLRTVTIAALLVLVLRAGSGRASELPDVVCGDAGARCRLQPRPALGAAGRRLFAGRSRGAVGRQPDRRAYSRFARRRPRYHALCGLPLSSGRALRRARQSARHAGRLRLGDADGPYRRPRHAVRIRCRMLAANGLRHRLDECGRALGGGPARRLRPRQLLRHRAVIAGDGGPACDRASQDAAALERRCARGARDHLGGRARRCRTFWLPPTAGPSRCAARTAGSPSTTPAASVCHPRMARRRYRRARPPRSRARQRHQLRSVRLHRQARRRPAGRLRAGAGRVRGGLPARNSHRGDARGAARLCRDRDRAQPLARARGAGAAPRRRGLYDRFRAAAEFRPAMGAECGAANGARRRGQFRCCCSAGSVADAAARRDTAARGSRSQTIEDQYRRNSPTSLP